MDTYIIQFFNVVQVNPRAAAAPRVLSSATTPFPPAQMDAFTGSWGSPGFGAWAPQQQQQQPNTRQPNGPFPVDMSGAGVGFPPVYAPLAGVQAPAWGWGVGPRHRSSRNNFNGAQQHRGSSIGANRLGNGRLPYDTANAAIRSNDYEHFIAH